MFFPSILENIKPVEMDHISQTAMGEMCVISNPVEDTYSIQYLQRNMNASYTLLCHGLLLTSCIHILQDYQTCPGTIISMA